MVHRVRYNLLDGFHGVDGGLEQRGSIYELWLVGQEVSSEFLYSLNMQCVYIITCTRPLAATVPECFNSERTLFTVVSW
jgi:hypothetical protein